MMTRLDNLPHFIHPFGCQLHFGAPLARDDISVPCITTASPLKPLATCMRLAQVFVSRAPELKAVLWETIDGEHRRIAEEVGLRGRRVAVSFRPSFSGKMC